MRNVVATLGTALTQEHARLLRRRLGDEGQVILCYDADDAGRRAAGTGARVLLEAGVEVSVLTLPQGMDPDDVVRERGVDTVHELLDSPKPLLEFLLLDIPTEPSRRRRAGLRLAPLVCSASDAAVRQNLVEELARHLYLRPREVEEAGRQPRRSQAVAQSTVRAPVPPGERELVRILLECSGEWRRRILELVHRDLFEDERVRKVLEEAGSVLKSDAEQADFVGELMQRCTDSDAANLVAELGNSKMPDITDETIRLQLQTIVQRQAQERSLRLAPLIAAAEASGNSSELDRLLAEKARLRQYSVEF